MKSAIGAQGLCPICKRFVLRRALKKAQNISDIVSTFSMIAHEYKRITGIDWEQFKIMNRTEKDLGHLNQLHLLSSQDTLDSNSVQDPKRLNLIIANID